MNAATVTIRPVVQWPRRAENDTSYGVTVDLILDDHLDWPYEDREEFVIGCVLDGGDAFTVEALGSTGVVLHRFGGTYGPARFVAHADREPRPDGSDVLRLTLVTEGGVPFQTVSLAVLPLDRPLTDADVNPIEASRWGIRPAEQRPARTPVPRPEPTPAPPRSARRTALLIGASIGGVAGIENDLEMMRDVLSRYGFDLRFCTGANATRAGILDAYDRLITDARPGDAVFVYYTGKGNRVRLPAELVRMDGDLDLGVISPVDWSAGTDDDFRGITAIELDLLHARLMERTRNVTVAFDTGGLEPSRVLPSDDATSIGRQPPGLVAHVERLRQQQLPIVAPLGNDTVVQLRACGRGQDAYEHTNSAGLRCGLFTDVLATALLDLVGLRVTWATLTQHVRRQVLMRTPYQRPECSGPTRRLLFDTVEQRDDSALPVEWHEPGRVRLLGAPLHAVHVGDEFAIMPAGAAGPDDATKLGVAVVEALRPMAADARFEPHPDATTPTIGAHAYRTRAVAPRLPVEVPQGNAATAGLVAALESSTFVRVAEPGEPSQHRVTVDDTGGLTIHDGIGPVTDPVHYPTGIRRVVTDLERLARAAALRAFRDEPTPLPAPPVHVEWGTVEDGRRRRLGDAGETVHVGEHVYIEIRNDSSEPVYVSLIDIGVAATVTVLTEFAPSGIYVPPLERYLFGSGDRGDLEGVALDWPVGLDVTRPRPETILVLITSAPMDVTVLEQTGVRGLGRSPLTQYLYQVATGVSRSYGGPLRPDMAYSVRSVDFWADPAAHRTAVSPYSASMTEDELRQLCVGIRPREFEVDETLVDAIVANVDTYARPSAQAPVPAPSDELRQRLPLLGWLMYEAALDQLARVQAGFEMLVGDAGERSRAAAAQVRRLADAARRLPWPQYAPRALGAIMACMLVEAGRETTPGDETQRQLVQELRDRHRSLRDASGGDRLGLNETFLQIALAAASSTVRIAERAVASRPDGEAHHLVIDLADAVRWGEAGLDAAAEIEHRYGFVKQVDENRMALASSYRRLSIVTCQALLLQQTLQPPGRSDLLSPRFASAFGYLYEPDDRPPSSVYTGSAARLLLHLALVRPGYELARPFPVGDVAVQRLDDRAVETLSAWLAEIVDGRQRGDGGIVASATMPAFIRTVTARSPGYAGWRLQWFTLDRYASQDGRRERIERLFMPDPRFTAGPDGAASVERYLRDPPSG